ncbi:hypothetical protein ACB092_03G153600 [Castanea dentata]
MFKKFLKFFCPLQQCLLKISQNKGKSVSNFWNDPSLAVARAHDVISTAELGRFSSIESHDLITQHLQKKFWRSLCT